MGDTPDIGHTKAPVGSIEHLWQKWWRKLWQAYPHHAKKGSLDPPSFLKRQFYRDVRTVLEHELSAIAPEKSVILRERIEQRIAGLEGLSREDE